MNNTRVLSFQQKLRSDISDISRAQWNGVDPTQAIARLVIVLVSTRRANRERNTASNNVVCFHGRVRSRRLGDWT